VNGYIEAGYSVVLGTLAVYGTTLIARERAARARLTPRRTPRLPDAAAGADESEPAAAQRPEVETS
jgi:hypothetical protein